MPTTSLPHHLVAFWFADIVGYSERAAQDEDGALQLIEILQALARSIVERHDGRVVKFLGDAVLAEFPSTEMAVRAAATLRQQFVKSQVERVVDTICASVFMLAMSPSMQTATSTVIVSMRLRGLKLRLILAR